MPESMLNRRSLLARSAAAVALSAIHPALLQAATASTEKRFIFIIQRGAADGLHTAPPLGDPGFSALRGGFQDSLKNAHKLNETFSLHPALGKLAGMYDRKQAIVVHAVASAYRDRSHFDGQNILESGATRPYADRDGWLNRLLPLLPDGKALALSPDVPLALRGAAPVSSYAPSGLPQAQEDMIGRVSRLYAQDAQLHGLWQSVMDTRNTLGTLPARRGMAPADLGRMAAKLMQGPQGARVLMIETGGWDTHNNQIAQQNKALSDLDALIDGTAQALGPAWSDTLILVATEFGRTAAINGTGGTDHGTGSAALLAGGSLNGGRVITDWPGLSQGALLEARDLKPTLATEALVCGAVAGHFGLDPALVARRLYPSQPLLRSIAV